MAKDFTIAATRGRTEQERASTEAVLDAVVVVITAFVRNLGLAATTRRVPITIRSALVVNVDSFGVVRSVAAPLAAAIVLFRDRDRVH